MSGSDSRNRKGNDNDGEDNTRLTNIYRPVAPKTSISPSELLNRYNKLLDRYPLRTKMVTSAIVSAFGSALGSILSSCNANLKPNNNNKK